MSQLSGRSTNNSAAAMLGSSRSDPSPSSLEASTTAPSAPVTSSSPSFVLSAHNLSQAFTQALGDSLPRILAAVQGQTASKVSAAGSFPTSTFTPSSSLAVNSPPGTAAGPSSGNFVVPSFVSTYCTLGNSSLSGHSFGSPSYGASSGAPPAFGQFSTRVFAPAATGSTLPHSIASLLHKPFRVGPGYSPIPEKLVSKIQAGQFIELADLLPENVKAQDTEPQSYLNGNLLVASKKRVREITDVMTWVEAFTVYMWIFCSAHPTRWPDLTQYKLLILQTARQHSGKAWLHYDSAFRKDAAASGLLDWSHMNSDLYNFHTRLPAPQPQLPSASATTSTLETSSSIVCRSWNSGRCAWQYGQCRYRHCCEKCEGEHPSINCPFRASSLSAQPSRFSPPRSKRQRR